MCTSRWHSEQKPAYVTKEQKETNEGLAAKGSGPFRGEGKEELVGGGGMAAITAGPGSGLDTETRGWSPTSRAGRASLGSEPLSSEI